MSIAEIDPFETLLREAGQGYLIDWHRPREDALPNLKQVLARANERGRARFGGNAPTLTPEALIATNRDYPAKVTAFLQVIGSVGSSEFLLLVWRVLQGMEINAIRMNYEEDQPFDLNVRLRSPYGEYEDYESTDIDDAVILRHLATMKMGDQGTFVGFFPLQVSGM